MTHTFKVGALFDPSARGGMPEGSHYAWDPIGHAGASHHRLVATARRPTGAEHVAFKSAGRVELALVVDAPAIVLLWRGAGWPQWSDAPYSWHLQAQAHERAGRGELGIPDASPLAPGAGVPLDMMLVDAADGILLALRRVAMPGDFAVALHAAIAEQAAERFDAHDYDDHVAALARVPLDSLAARAAAQCALGGGRGAR